MTLVLDRVERRENTDVPALCPNGKEPKFLLWRDNKYVFWVDVDGRAGGNIVEAIEVLEAQCEFAEAQNEPVEQGTPELLAQLKQLYRKVAGPDGAPERPWLSWQGDEGKETTDETNP